MKTILFSLFFVLTPLLVLAEESTATPAGATVEAAKPVEKVAADETQYSGDQAQIKKKMDDLFESSRHVNKPGAEGEKARKEIELALDWDKVAQVCIGPAFYKKQTTANLNEFKRLLKEVIVKTAYTRLDKFWADGTTYKISKIDLKGNSASLLSKFSVKGQTFALEYYLNKKGNTWYVWDIAYEGERYSVNINEQLDAFLKEKKFTDLLEKLKKRLEELTDQGKTKKG